MAGNCSVAMSVRAGRWRRRASWQNWSSGRAGSWRKRETGTEAEEEAEVAQAVHPAHREPPIDLLDRNTYTVPRIPSEFHILPKIRIKVNWRCRPHASFGQVLNNLRQGPPLPHDLPKPPLLVRPWDGQRAHAAVRQDRARHSASPRIKALAAQDDTHSTFIRRSLSWQ